MEDSVRKQPNVKQGGMSQNKNISDISTLDFFILIQNHEEINVNFLLSLQTFVVVPPGNK